MGQCVRAFPAAGPTVAGAVTGIRLTRLGLRSSRNGWGGWTDSDLREEPPSPREARLEENVTVAGMTRANSCLVGGRHAACCQHCPAGPGHQDRGSHLATPRQGPARGRPLHWPHVATFPSQQWSRGEQSSWPCKPGGLGPVARVGTVLSPKSPCWLRCP